MLISLQDATAFLQKNYAVFEELWRHREEPLSDADLLAVITSANPPASPSYILGQLKSMRFIVETDAHVGLWEIASPFARWLEHLQQIARPVSSALVRGRLQELEHHLAAFRVAETRDDINEGKDIMRDVRNAFQSLVEDLGQTRTAIAATVSEVKSEHRKQTAVDRYRRINRLWNEYLLPMLELLDPTGQLETLCAAWERQLAFSLEKKFLPERRIAERIEAEMQFLRVAIRQSFRECRNELEPLHARLRRDTQLAEGAARILALIEREGIATSPFSTCLPNSTFRYAGQITRAALEANAARWRDFSTPPPAIDFAAVPTATESQAVEEILADVDARSSQIFPVKDLLDWLAREHEPHGFHAILQSFSLLVTDTHYQASFSQPISEYTVAGGVVRCGCVTLEIRQTT